MSGNSNLLLRLQRPTLKAGRSTSHKYIAVAKSGTPEGKWPGMIHSWLGVLERSIKVVLIRVTNVKWAPDVENGEE